MFSGSDGTRRRKRNYGHACPLVHIRFGGFVYLHPRRVPGDPAVRTDVHSEIIHRTNKKT